MSIEQLTLILECAESLACIGVAAFLGWLYLR
jgi:hypothetical protein